MDREKNLNDILSERAQMRDAAIKLAEDKKRIMQAKIPQLVDIDRVLEMTGPRIMRAARSGGDVEKKIEAIERENAELLKKRAELLSSKGIDPNFDEPEFSCPICRDTGYDGAVICKCVKAEYNKYLYERSGLGKALEEQNFDNFSLKYYSSSGTSAQNGVTERENAENILECCRDFAENIDKKGGNLLMTGGTGLGKTHLSTAVAKKAIDKGLYVIYDTAQNIFRECEDNRFGRKTTDVSRFEEADLLIIDDLGAEYINQFSVAEFYNLINSRTLNKKSTVVSTNLSPKEIKNNYHERITSRLFGEFTVLFFFGRDIRMLKVANG